MRENSDDTSVSGDPAATTPPGGVAQDRAEMQRIRAERDQDEAELRSIRRRRRVRAIGEPGPELAEALRDEDPAVRRAGLANPHCSVEQQLAVLHCDEDPDVRYWAECALPSVGCMPAELVAGFLPDAGAGGRWSVRPVRHEASDRLHSGPRTYILRSPSEPARSIALIIRDGAPAATARYAVLRHREDIDEYLARSGGDRRRAGVADPGARRHPEVRAVIAALAGAPASLLAAYGLRDPDRRVREVAVANAGFPVDLLPRAAHDADPRVRRALLSRPEAGAQVVADLAADAHTGVRVAAVSHGNCPADALATAAAAKEAEVRLAALGNVNCPAAAAERALRHRDYRTRLQSLSQPTRLRPQAVFDCLMDTRSFARRRRQPPEELRASAVAALCGVARSGWAQVCGLALERLPQEDLRRLVAEDPDGAAGDRRESVRRLAAEDPRCGATALMSLAVDRRVSVRRALAERDWAPSQVWRLLILDEDERVPLRLAQNPHLDEAALAEMIDTCGAAVRLTLVDHRGLTATLLRRLARDPEPAVRRAASGLLMRLVMPA
jgi:hypothetical protein